MLLLGVADVAASKRFYVDHGLAVAKSFGRRYVEFATASSPVKLALYGRRALARDAGIPDDGTGSHRLVEKSLASAHDVRVKLAGPGIKTLTVNCGWSTSPADLTCAVRIPSEVRTGGSQKYALTTAEGLVGYGFLTVPEVRGTADPEVIHFK